MNEQITLTVSVQEVNGILAGLGQLPYVQVVELIAKLKQQAEGQLQKPEGA